jgi:hypothetical protein
MIDRVILQSRIRQYADNLIIDQLGEAEIALFVSKSKDIVEYAFDNYINEQFELFHSRVKPEKESEFSSFTDGYVAKMKRWMSSNGISLKPTELTIPKNLCDEQPTSSYNHDYIKIAVGGTLIAAGLLMLPKVITLPDCIVKIPTFAAIAVEIIALGLAYRAFKKNNNQQKEDCVTTNMESRKDFTDNLDFLKNRLISEIWLQLDDWLNKAEKESDKILNSFIYE